MIPAYYSSPAVLAPLAEKLHDEFCNAKPYRHVVIDDFFPAEIADEIWREFPKAEIMWDYAGPGLGKPLDDKVIYKSKLYQSDENYFPPFIRHIMHDFNSMTFIMFLESLSGINQIIPDHTYSGCGLHSTGRGGRLLIHIDQSRHPDQRLDQMLNMIYFCNKEWNEEWGGHFELWDERAERCVKKVAPVFNRLLIFETGTSSYHGHPHPLNCPEEVRRNSLSVYYYIVDRPRDNTYMKRCDMVGWVPKEPEDIDYAMSKMAEHPDQVIGSTKYFADEP